MERANAGGLLLCLTGDRQGWDELRIPPCEVA